MSDTIIVYNFLSREFPDNHPVIYIYICGQKASEILAIDKIMSLTKNIFCPPFSEIFILDIVKLFLNDKKQAYNKGLINVKSFYD
jgi:hypothetical protein